MAEELGSGLFLDESLDFDIASNGDLLGQSGAEELNKDLAFQLLIILDDLSGAPLSPTVRSQIKSRTVNTLLSDTRVQQLDEDGITLTEVGQNTIQVRASYLSVEGKSELVFNL